MLMSTPMRMCAITREMKPKSELIRLVKKDGQILVDIKQRIEGRGVWISKDENILQNLQKSRCLNRAFKCEVNNDIYKQVEELCHKVK